MEPEVGQKVSFHGATGTIKNILSDGKVIVEGTYFYPTGEDEIPSFDLLAGEPWRIEVPSIEFDAFNFNDGIWFES